MSAALLAVVTAGVYAGIDGPQRVSGNAKSRAAAANLAQTDQESMRSMRFVDLQNYSQSYTRTIDGVNYTIASRADWVDDSTAKAGCTVGNGQGDYLRLNSTVSWPNGGAGNPTTITSLMAPPVDDGSNGTGNIVMRLKDQAGNPVTGIPVTIDGRTNLTRTTDAGGCAVFTNVPAGDYTTTFSQAGYVDNLNVQPVSVPTPLRAGDTVQVEHLYAQAAGVTVSFKDSTGATMSWPRATVAGGTLVSPLRLSGVTMPLATGKVLYPSTSGSFVAWAGNCADPGATYDATATPAPAPNAISSAVVTVPTLKFTAPTAGVTGTPRVTVKPSDGTCTDTFNVPTAAVSGTQYVWPVPLPFGKYSVCADMSGYRTATNFTLQNLVATGTTVALAFVTDSFGNITGVRATPSDGTPVQTVGIASGTCP